MSLPAFGFQDDHVRRRRRVIGLDGGCHAAHMNRKMGLAEAAVFARRSRAAAAVATRLAKGLHRHARRRRDVIVGCGGVTSGCSSEF